MMEYTTTKVEIINGIRFKTLMPAIDKLRYYTHPFRNIDNPLESINHNWIEAKVAEMLDVVSE